jgi:hypothetical protein
LGKARGSLGILTLHSWFHHKDWKIQQKRAKRSINRKVTVYIL